MIKVKINKVEYSIKTSWNELTYGEYLNIVEAEDELTSVSILSSIPVDYLLRMDEESLNKLTACLSFMQELPSEEVEAKDIRESSFGQKILFQQKAKELSQMRVLGVALAIYEYNYKELEESLLEVFKLPFTYVYCLGLNYIEQLGKICEIEAEHLKSDVTNEQKRAGIDMFNEFEVMNTIDSLAGGNILNYEKVLEIDYNTVFIKLKMLKFASQYKENYAKIMSKKK